MTCSSTQPDTLLGIALGAPHEPSGLVLVERCEALGDWDKVRKHWQVVPNYKVTGVRRITRSGGYGSLAAAAVELWPSAKLRMEHDKARQVVLADVSASGRAALEPCRTAGLFPVPVDVSTAIGGKPVRRAYEVGRPELVAALAVVREEDRLRIERSAGAELLAEELRGARAKPEDCPLVDALSLALWWGEQRMRARLATPRPPREAVAADLAAAFRLPTFAELVKRRRA